MPKAPINDLSLYYEVHGQGEPLVLIAGFGADHTAWLPVLDKLKAKYQVVLFDNRGCGESSVPSEPFCIEDMSKDVELLCKYLTIKQAHFIGNSLGGFILQQLAYNNKHLVKSAVISNSTVNAHCSYNIYAQAQLELLQAQAPLSAIIKSSCSWVYSYSFLAKPNVLEELIQLILNNPHPFTVAGYEGQLQALTTFNSEKWVDQITCPTLILGGDEDIIFPERLVKNLANKIPHSQYFSFKQCGHLPFIEQPELFVKVISKFLEKL